MGMEGVAYERFKQCLALEPSDPHILATAGGALAHFDDPEAEAALRTAALTAPQLPLARWMYGSYLAREGMLDDALVHLDAAVDLDPESPVPIYERGVAYALAGHVQRALDDLGRASSLDPDDGWMPVLLGLLEVEAGRIDEAAGDLAAGARIREDDVEAQVLAALASTAAGWDDQGYEMLERARLRAVPGDQDLIESAASRIDGGAGPARRFLDTVLAPSALRERLMSRP
jgi:tetratricopeptide (TPR) repeat protein